MIWPRKKTRLFTLIGDEGGTFFCEFLPAPMGLPKIKVLASVESMVLDDAEALKEFLAPLEDLQGKVSCALPLSQFIVEEVSLPAMPDGAIRKALPYHLAKRIDRPLSEMMFQWQIARRQKNQLEIMAYLLPSRSFELVNQAVSDKNLSLASFECDIFAAFSFLALQKRLQAGQATLGLLLGPKSLSLAVYENRKLTSVKNIPLPQPADDFRTELDIEIVPQGEAVPVEEAEEASDDDGGEDIIAGFDLFGTGGGPENPDGMASLQLAGNDEEAAAVAPPEQAVASPSPSQNWPDYYEEVGLEIMRTMDSYAAQSPDNTAVSRVAVGGAEYFFEELQEVVQDSLGLEIEPIIDLEEEENFVEDFTGEFPPIYTALNIGTGYRE